MVVGDARLDQLVVQRTKPAERTLFIKANQPAVASYIGREYCHKAAFGAARLLGNHRCISPRPRSYPIAKG
jgi:hypothetical protein